MLTNLLTRPLRKALLPAALLLGACPTAIAEDALVVNFHDSTQAYYRLASTPEVTFDGDYLCVRDADSNDRYEFPKVDTFTFGEYLSAAAIEAEGARIVCHSNSTIEFCGFEPGTAITVADAAGRLWYSGTTGAEGHALVDVSSLSAGIYIVSTSTGQTLKIVKA